MRDFCDDSTATNPAPDDAVDRGRGRGLLGLRHGVGAALATGTFFTGATGSAAAGGGMLAADATLDRRLRHRP